MGGGGWGGERSKFLPQQKHGLPYYSRSMSFGKDDFNVHEGFSEVIQSAVVTFCKIAALPACIVCRVLHAQL